MRSASLLLSVAVLSLATTASAQSEEHKHGQDAESPKAQAQEPAKPAAAPKTEAQKTFEAMRILAGEWEAPVTVTPDIPQMRGAKLHVTMRVLSRGNTIAHEFQEVGTPLDFMKYDHPLTMIYLGEDKQQIELIHYCDAGNRPHMKATVSPDGKTIAFDFVDITGPTKLGHMRRAVFTLIDENHHREEWTFIMPGDKQIVAAFDAKRVQTVAQK
jgi:hypothetical protein